MSDVEDWCKSNGVEYLEARVDTQNLKMTPQLGIVSSAFASTGESKPDMKLVFYTGHTLQGSYKGKLSYMF